MLCTRGTYILSFMLVAICFHGALADVTDGDCVEQCAMALNRRAAAQEQHRCVRQAYDAGTVVSELFLDAQRRLIDAECHYLRVVEELVQESPSRDHVKMIAAELLRHRIENEIRLTYRMSEELIGKEKRRALEQCISLMELKLSLTDTPG